MYNMLPTSFILRFVGIGVMFCLVSHVDAAMYAGNQSPLLDGVPEEPSAPMTPEEQAMEAQALQAKAIPSYEGMNGNDRARELLVTNGIDISSLQFYLDTPANDKSHEYVCCNIWHSGFPALSQTRLRFSQGKLVDELCPFARKEVSAGGSLLRPIISMRRAILGHRKAVMIAKECDVFQAISKSASIEDCPYEPDILRAELIYKDQRPLWFISPRGLNESLNPYFASVPPFTIIDAISGRVLHVRTGKGIYSRLYYTHTGQPAWYSPLMAEIPNNISAAKIEEYKKLIHIVINPALKHKTCDNQSQKIAELLKDNGISSEDLQFIRISSVHPSLQDVSAGIDIVHCRIWHKGMPTYKYIHYAFIDGKIDSSSNPSLRKSVAAWDVNPVPKISFEKAMAGYCWVANWSENTHVQNDGWPDKIIPQSDLSAELLADQQGVVWHIFPNESSANSWRMPEILLDGVTGEIFYSSRPGHYGKMDIHSRLRYNDDDALEFMPPQFVPPEPRYTETELERNSYKNRGAPRKIVHNVNEDQVAIAQSLFNENGIDFDNIQIIRMRQETTQGIIMTYIRGFLWSNGFPTSESTVHNFIGRKISYEHSKRDVVSNKVSTAALITCRQAVLTAILMSRENSRHDCRENYPPCRPVGLVSEGDWGHVYVGLEVQRSGLMYNASMNGNAVIDALTGRIVSYDTGIIVD